MPRRRRPPRSGAITELPPLRILGQIALLQCLYYTAALVLMVFTSLVAGTRFDLDLVFGWGALRGDTTQGWLVGFVWMCCAGVIIIALVVLIGRSKLIPDYALTLHFIHLLVTTVFTGLVPRYAMWWLVMACSSAATVSGGMAGCRWHELRPISFGGIGGGTAARTGDRSKSGTVAETAGLNGRLDVDRADGEDLEVGMGRGGRGRGRGGRRGRGRGGGGTGEYEMMGMKGNRG